MCPLLIACRVRSCAVQALAGFTLDYGPFGFMEKFNPAWNPWVGGGVPYCFGRQPNAAAVNLVGLSEAFVQMVEHAAKAERREAADIQEAITKVRFGVRDTFVDSFDAAHDDACRRKLGFKSWDEEAQAIWDELFTLMSSKCGDSQDSGIDFTNFLPVAGQRRELGAAIYHPFQQHRCQQGQQDIR